MESNKQGEAKMVNLSDRPILEIKERAQPSCAHKLIEVDQDERVLRCRTCNAIVDPIDFIIDLARDENILIKQRKNLRLEIDKLRKQKRELLF